MGATNPVSIRAIQNSFGILFSCCKDSAFSLICLADRHPVRMETTAGWATANWREAVLMSTPNLWHITANRSLFPAIAFGAGEGE